MVQKEGECIEGDTKRMEHWEVPVGEIHLTRMMTESCELLLMTCFGAPVVDYKRCTEKDEEPYDQRNVIVKSSLQWVERVVAASLGTQMQWAEDYFPFD